MVKERLTETVEKARRGDESAKEALYLDAYKSVYRFALRLVKNPEDAEDIMQEVFIAVNDKISDLREPAAFYKWVNQITANKCNEQLRRYKGIAFMDDEDQFLSLVDDDPANLPDRATDDEETRKIIMDVVDDLPDGQRACVLYYYYAQFTVAQIADALDISEGTVKSRLSAARAKIRAALEEKERKEGIKLYGIPLALAPILRQALEQMELPEGLSERVWENVQKASSAGMPPDSGSSNTSGSGLNSGAGGAAAGQAATGAVIQSVTAAVGMTLTVKIVLGVIAAAVITMGAILIPKLTAPPESITTSAPSISPQANVTASPSGTLSAAKPYVPEGLEAFLGKNYDEIIASFGDPIRTIDHSFEVLVSYTVWSSETGYTQQYSFTMVDGICTGMSIFLDQPVRGVSVGMDAEEAKETWGGNPDLFMKDKESVSLRNDGQKTYNVNYYLRNEDICFTFIYEENEPISMILITTTIENLRRLGMNSVPVPIPEITFTPASTSTTTTPTPSPTAQITDKEHPYATALREFFSGAGNEPKEAYLADIDGDGVEEMLAWYGEDYGDRDKEGRLFSIQNGELLTIDLLCGSVGSWYISSTNYLAYAVGEGLSVQWSVYELKAGELVRIVGIGTYYDEENEMDTYILYYNAYGETNDEMTKEEFDAYDRKYGLYDAGLPDETAKILAMTIET